ncbi:secondary thiamine-phosphate synthase enzyme YjbQ [Engelhardtia mirabilis]|uniref:Secondary thiamine-phosphate synthase enzyme n=1 Tax=Engelhardtia mirabilis TaxID=2528011 RepID=A0A518BLI3_9BACT|nr:hypothetical protein Pla133_29250 [Planctomycetes bacterium Pla133]QDV02162.1 hypothetical protein Pla86_29240 [Planctomycetes bacterium Pla86]
MVLELHTDCITVDSPGRGTIDVTAQLQHVVAESGVRNGLAQVFLRHTSASLVISENADPDVRRDLDAFLARLVPDGDGLYQHVAEGPDDMPAHVRAALTQTSVGVPVRDGRCAFGTWQALYLWEHRLAAHRRQLDVTVVGRR